MTVSLSLTVGEALERAVETCQRVRGGGAGAARELTFYKLGTGGRHPDADAPWDHQRQCDCSGFVAWVLGYDRLQSDDVWINTDAILAGRAGLFGPVAAAEPVSVGDALVYGSIHVNGERRPGHVGIITEVAAGFVRGGPEWWRDLRVAHCSPSNSRAFGSGHAIAETDARIWRSKGRIVRFRRFAEPVG
jgi:hypothetical protein